MRYSIDIFNKSDIAKINDIVNRLNRFKPNVDRFIKEVCEVGKAKIEELVPSANVTIEYDGNKAVITAQSRVICFLEFGTGYPTDSGHPNADKMPFDVEPGSWSKEFGKNTWEKWINAGKDPQKYPYNHEAKYPMLRAYEAMVQAMYDKAKEIWK